jgi:hypothetical protein
LRILPCIGLLAVEHEPLVANPDDESILDVVVDADQEVVGPEDEELVLLLDVDHLCEEGLEQGQRLVQVLTHYLHLVDPDGLQLLPVALELAQDDVRTLNHPRRATAALQL